MQLYIMRHGEAVSRAASDALRPLSEEGTRASIAMAKQLKAQGISFDKVLVSPYLRAQQTYDAVASQLSLNQVVEQCDDITPNGDERQVASYLEALAAQGVQSLLLISHLPLVGYLVSALCPEQNPPMMGPSEVAHLAIYHDKKNEFMGIYA